MRETDKIANEMFDGRIKNTIQYIVNNYDDKEIERFYREEWKDRECDMADAFIAAKSMSHLSLDEIHQLKKDLGIDNQTSRLMHAVHMTEEEIINCDGNPFVKKTASYLIALLCAVFIPFVIGWILEASVSDATINFMMYAKVAALIAVTPVAIRLAAAIECCFKFRKLKKEFMEAK